MTCSVLRPKQLIEPCLFPDGPIAMQLRVRSLLSFVIITSVLASTYDPVSTLQSLVKFTVVPVTSSLGENPPVIPYIIGKTFKHRTQLYIFYIITMVGMNRTWKSEVVHCTRS